MSELTQLERAQLVAAKFIPKDPPGPAYVYVFCGQATWDASEYKVIDGQVLMSKRIWHVDQSQTNCIAYCGEGCNGRIDTPKNHPVISAPNLRLKLRTNLSIPDSIELEKLIITELGCIADSKRSDGCLVNLRRYRSGPFVCKQLEAHAYVRRQALLPFSAARSVDIIAMTVDKEIVARGSAKELERQLGFANPNIIKCCRNKLRGLWHNKASRSIYFCYAKDYLIYKIKPMTNHRSQAARLMIAQKADGSDICCGNARSIRRYASEIKDTSSLHKVAQGKKQSAYNWTCNYIDDLEASVETIPATPFNFY